MEICENERRARLEPGEVSGGSSPAAMSRMQVHQTSAAVSVIGSVLIAVGRLFEPLGDRALDLLGEHQAPYALFADRFAVLPRSIWKAERRLRLGAYITFDFAWPTKEAEAWDTSPSRFLLNGNSGS